MRIFVAIEINDKNVLDSISKIQSELKINAKPVKIQNLHFTVQFLGEVFDRWLKKLPYLKASNSTRSNLRELVFFRDGLNVLDSNLSAKNFIFLYFF